LLFFLGLIVIFIILLWPKPAVGTEIHTEYGGILAQSVEGTSGPLVIETSQQTHSKAPQSVKTPLSVVDCVTRLKRVGRLPGARVTNDGYARSIPVKPVDLEPGMIRVVKTNEGEMGHILEVAVEKDGTIRSITEGGHPVGEGRIVPPSVIRGEVVAAIPR
jgi:hypothetical protein